MNAALLVGHSQDAWTRTVAEAVRRRGGRPLVLLTDTYPLGFQLGYDAAGATLLLDGETWSDADLSAVWHRRYARPAAIEDHGEPLTSFMRDECDRALSDWLAALRCFHVDPPHAAKAAASKLRQIREASGFGFEAPRTWLGNDPRCAREFVASVGGPVICKPFTPAATADAAVFANRLSPDDVEALDSLDTTPMIFQEEVPRRLEVRLTVIGRQVRTVALDASRTQETPDYRRLGNQIWQAVEPPAAIVASARAMADATGLQYGAFDFLVTPEDRWVFLELNPWGECFWLDELGLDMSGAIAEVLLEPAARR